MLTKLSFKMVFHRSSLNDENDKSAFGAFVAIDPSHQTLSLRTLVSFEYMKDISLNKCLVSRQVSILH